MTTSCQPEMSPSAQRVVHRCRAVLKCDQAADPCAALFDQLVDSESLATASLMRLGISDLRTADRRPELPQQDLDAVRVTEADDPGVLVAVFDRARANSRRRGSLDGVTTEDLLLALAEVSRGIQTLLAEHAVSLDALRHDLSGPAHSVSDVRIPVGADFQLTPGGEPDSSVDTRDRRPFDAAASVQGSDCVWRVIDANSNRAREGLRVLEDVARFVLDDRTLCEHAKILRHELVAAGRLLEQQGDASPTLQARDTASDVGTELTTAGELSRRTLLDVVKANCHRAQESLRCLEEFGKLLSPEYSGAIRQLRYQSYILEQHLIAACGNSPLPGADHVGIARALVYLLVTEANCCRPWKETVEQSLAAGADVVQLREKHLGDRELIARGRWLADACRTAGAISIINDRVDLAVACGSSGAHVGQDELPLAMARHILGARVLGISTHDAAQVDSASNSAADYLGVGPVFRSSTKHFDGFINLELLRDCADRIQKPWFAIGGIAPDNIDRVVAAGARRVAVSGAVLQSDRPAEVISSLKSQLLAHSP